MKMFCYYYRKVHGYTHIVVFIPIHTNGVRVHVDVYNPQHRQVMLSPSVLTRSILDENKNLDIELPN